MDYEDYEKKVKVEREKNKKYLEEFETWLNKKGLADKTINNHIMNADLYINEYLNYYEVNQMEDGCYKVEEFFEDWFVRKCMWSTSSTIKTTAASLKKFYACMLELGHIKKESYDSIYEDIKDNMEFWCDNIDEYNNFDFDNFLL